MATIHGTTVSPIAVHNTSYVKVADRVHAAIVDTGYSMISTQSIEINGRYFMTVKIAIDRNGRTDTYIGTAEIKFAGAKAGSADDLFPIECAETSALGRALAFAGFGIVDAIASADEIARVSNNVPNATAPSAAPSPSGAIADIHAWREKYSINKTIVADYMKFHRLTFAKIAYQLEHTVQTQIEIWSLDRGISRIDLNTYQTNSSLSNADLWNAISHDEMPIISAIEQMRTTHEESITAWCERHRIDQAVIAAYMKDRRLSLELIAYQLEHTVQTQIEIWSLDRGISISDLNTYQNERSLSYTELWNAISENETPIISEIAKMRNVEK